MTLNYQLDQPSARIVTINISCMKNISTLEKCSLADEDLIGEYLIKFAFLR